MKIKSIICYAALASTLSIPGLAQAGFSPFNWMDDARDSFDSNRGDYGRYGSDRYGPDYGRSGRYDSPYGYNDRDSYDGRYGRERWERYDQWEPNYWRYRYLDSDSPDYLPEQFGGDRFSGNPNRAYRNDDSRRYDRGREQYNRPYSNQNRYSGQRRGYRSDYEGSAEQNGDNNSRGGAPSQNRP